MPARASIPLVLGGIAALLALLAGACRQIGVKSNGSPAGRVVRAGSHLAVVIETCDPYLPSLKGVPQDRMSYSYELWLFPDSGTSPHSTTTLARSVRSSDRTHNIGAQYFENDILWFTISDVQGFDLSSRSITSRPVPKHIASMPISQLMGYNSRPEEPFLAKGVLWSPSDWFTLASDTEAATDLAPNARINPSDDAVRSRNPRTLRLASIASTPLPRVTSTDASISSPPFRHAAFLRDAPSGNVIRFSNPDSFLVFHREGDSVHPTLRLSRVGLDGSTIWTLDTQIDKLTQILPHPTSPAFVGDRYIGPDKLAEPILAIARLDLGTVHIHSLRTNPN